MPTESELKWRFKQYFHPLGVLWDVVWCAIGMVAILVAILMVYMLLAGGVAWYDIWVIYLFIAVFTYCELSVMWFLLGRALGSQYLILEENHFGEGGKNFCIFPYSDRYALDQIRTLRLTTRKNGLVIWIQLKNDKDSFVGWGIQKDQAAEIFRSVRYLSPEIVIDDRCEPIKMSRLQKFYLRF